MDFHPLLKEYFARRDVCIVNVPTPETRTVNGSTSLILFDPREPPVFDRGVLYTMDLHIWDQRYRLHADPTALSINERVLHISALVATGITESIAPVSPLPFYFYVENGHWLWRNAALKFRKQYATVGR